MLEVRDLSKSYATSGATAEVRAIDGNRLRIGPIEAIDGTPVVDIKPVLKCSSPS